MFAVVPISLTLYMERIQMSMKDIRNWGENRGSGATAELSKIL